MSEDTTSASKDTTSGSRAGLVLAAGFVTSYFALTMRALDGYQLHNDLGIQYYLARITSEGAVPLIDFEHGWNTLSWYYSALLYELAGGNATIWVNLWGRGGFIMAALAMLAIAWRLRLPATWIAGLTAVWIVLTHVPHNKYAIPTVWVALLISPLGGVGARSRRVRWWDSTSAARALRVGLAATVFWAHVELAILLAIGTAMFDLFGGREGNWGRRLATAIHAPLGVAVGLGSQIAVYAALGIAPRDFLGQAIGNWTVTDFGPLFDFPIAAPDSIRLAIFPMMMLLPFIPLVWQRLSDPSRLVAMCNLAMGLIAIRRPGDGHAAAAGTLAALVVVLGAHDVHRARDQFLGALRAVRWTSPGMRLWSAVGVGWYGAGIAAGFQIASLVAIVALTLVSLAAVAGSSAPMSVGRQDEMTAASAGALALAVTVALWGVGGHLFEISAQDDALAETMTIAEAVREPLDSCLATGPAGTRDREVWVVDSPLTLYSELDLTNPTPFYAFWYNLEGEKDRIIEMMDRGEIPAILQVGSWPESLRTTVPEVEMRYEACASVPVNRTGTVTVWLLSST